MNQDVTISTTEGGDVASVTVGGVEYLPPPRPRTVYGAPVVIEIVGRGGRTALVHQVITFAGYGTGPVVLREGEHLEARILDPDGRVT